MNPPTTPPLEADLHRLELRFAPLRIQRPQALERLSASIERSGQLVPVIAVAEAGQGWVLIDGYRRVQALRRCGRDTAWVELWDCDLAQALLRALASQVRPWEPLEEAALIRELITRHGRSQRDIARHSGRDASWVSRRLALIEALPEAALAAVCRGELSTWAATRVLAPLARANTAHAQAVLEALRRAPLSTRELERWYRHYQQANRPTREHLVQQPQLFLKALRAREDAQQARRLRAGPEGAWLQDLQRIGQLCQRLGERLPVLFDPAPRPQDRLRLVTAFVHAKAHWESLQASLDRHCPDGLGSASPGDPDPA